MCVWIFCCEGNPPKELEEDENTELDGDENTELDEGG